MGGQIHSTDAPSTDVVKEEQLGKEVPVEVKEDATAPVDVPAAETQEVVSEETQGTVEEAVTE